MYLSDWTNVVGTCERMCVLADVIGEIDWAGRIESLSDAEAKRLLTTFDKCAANFVSAFDKLNWAMTKKSGCGNHRQAMESTAFSAYNWISHSEMVQTQQALPAGRVEPKPVLNIRWPNSMRYSCNDCTRTFQSMEAQQSHCRVTGHCVPLQMRPAFD